MVLPGGDLLFSDIPNDRVLRWSPAGGVRVAQQPAGYANGHTLDRDGSVIRCEHGGRRVSRVAPDGTVTGIVDRYRGRRLNSPNDVVVRSDGTIWFTDPPYGILSDREGHQAQSELGDNYVFCFDPATGELSVVTDVPEEPNGLAFAPGEAVLYVTDSATSSREAHGGGPILAFDVVDGPRLERPRLFATVPGIADGLRVDGAGNVYSSSAEGIVVLSPAGDTIACIDVPEVVTNCAFGGSGGTTLFVTAATSLYAVDLTGRHGVPGAGVRTLGLGSRPRSGCS